MSFNKWYNDADIPLQDENGLWYDAETGFPYGVDSNMSSDSKDYYFIKKGAKAKSFGGNALSGSSKQKSWGEDIRSSIIERLEKMGCESIKEFVFMKTTSKWFIDNREIDDKKLLAAAKSAVKSFNNKIAKLTYSDVFSNNYDLTVWREKYEDDASRQRANVIRKMEEEGYSQEDIQSFIAKFKTAEDFMSARGHNKPFKEFISEFYK